MTPIGTFRDITKVYDINHKVLLSKLNSYGIRVVANLWFESYLSHWKQCVEINSIKQGICLDYKGNCVWCATVFDSWSNTIFIVHK
jgi:hypothetical protein